MKKKVLISSILKPVNEPRMYKKLGLTLSENLNLDVHISGFKPENFVADEKITFHPIFDFNRLSLKRFGAGKKFAQLLKTIKPDILIVNTFELLNEARKYKLKYNCKLIYDVRENHQFNIRYLGIYPLVIKELIAKQIGRIEHKNAKFIDHFILAESCYADELTFLDSNYTVIENKYEGAQLTSQGFRKKPVKFVFTGTIHKSSGVFDAIDFVKSLNQNGEASSLEIIGYCPHLPTFESLKTIEFNWLVKNISVKPMSPESIVSAYQNCDIAIAPYKLSLQNQNKVPTKLFECLANGIPMIISLNPFWIEYTKAHNWIYYFSFENDNPQKLMNKILLNNKEALGDQNALWETEKTKLKGISIFLDKP